LIETLKKIDGLKNWYPTKEDYDFWDVTPRGLVD
jgi:hypothetical protein